jgi:hypothetical protein
VNAVMKFRFPQNARNLLTSWETAGFEGRTALHGVNSSISQSASQPANQSASQSVGRSLTEMETF